MKPKHPQPVAYCWLHGREMSKRAIKHKGCDDPEKQAGKRVCTHLQYYGSQDHDLRRLDLMECYRAIQATLDEYGATLDGASLVQELPSGGRVRVWRDEAEKYWREREDGSD